MATAEAFDGQVAAGDEPALCEMPWRRVGGEVIRALVPLPVAGEGSGRGREAHGGVAWMACGVSLLRASRLC